MGFYTLCGARFTLGQAQYKLIIILGQAQYKLLLLLIIIIIIIIIFFIIIIVIIVVVVVVVVVVVIIIIIIPVSDGSTCFTATHKPHGLWCQSEQDGVLLFLCLRHCVCQVRTPYDTTPVHYRCFTDQNRLPWCGCCCC